MTKINAGVASTVSQSSCTDPIELVARGYERLTRGEFSAAIHCFEHALKLEANLPMAHNNIGWAHQCQGDTDVAVGCYRRALGLNSGFRLAQINLASLLSDIGRGAEARPIWQSLVAAHPTDAAILDQVTTAFLKVQDLRNAAVIADQHAMLTHGSRWFRSVGHTPPPEVPSPEPLLSGSKLRHDIEQLDYLRVIGILNQELTEAIDAYGKVLGRIGPMGDDARVPLDSTAREQIGHVYSRIVHRPQAERVRKSLSGSWDCRLAEEEYLASPFGLVVVDNFLSEAALESLRRFCIQSTIWFTNRYSYGRLGAFFREGFNCPLLVQIAEELRAVFPRLLADRHRLMQMWAFKYNYSQPLTGAHADFAAVNVNLWLTPEAANKGGGGLVIYNSEAPADWGFRSYNGFCGNKIEEFLAERDGYSVTIPYRENRAVIFNSDLFHRTEPINFEHGYENRRINVTMLFGKREDAHTSAA